MYSFELILGMGIRLSIDEQVSVLSVLISIVLTVSIVLTILAILSLSITLPVLVISIKPCTLTEMTHRSHL